MIMIHSVLLKPPGWVGAEGRSRTSEENTLSTKEKEEEDGAQGIERADQRQARTWASGSTQKKDIKKK